MARHFGKNFGKRTVLDNYRSKMKWLVGTLVSVIVILITSVVLIAMKHSPEKTIEQKEAKKEIETTVDILVTNGRIEHGQAIDANMLSSVPISIDKMPMAAIRAKDVSSVINKFASKMVLANTPLMLGDLDEKPPFKPITIPAGYRAISINVDPITAVGGFVTPGSRVDVMMTFRHRGKRKITTLAHFVKVVSIGQNTANVHHTQVSRKGTTATLLVQEKEARKIELARNIGSLSLALLGDAATPGDAKPSAPMDEGKIFGFTEEKAEIANDGVMYASDPRTGRNVRYVLNRGRWAIDKDFTP